MGPGFQLGKIKKSSGTRFPGGSVVKNLPASAGDAGSIPGPGGPMCLGAVEPVCTTPEPARTLTPLIHKRGQRNEKPAHCN